MGLRSVILTLGMMVGQPGDVVLGQLKKTQMKARYLLLFCLERVSADQGPAFVGGFKSLWWYASQASTWLSDSISLQDYSCKSEAADCSGDLTLAPSPPRDS